MGHLVWTKCRNEIGMDWGPNPMDFEDPEAVR